MNRVISAINFFETEPMSPCVSIKTPGMLFDNKLTGNLSGHFNKVMSICYSNLRNLGKIASKLSVKLKIQLVHSMMLCHLGYCNGLFYGLPDCIICCIDLPKCCMLLCALFLALSILNDAIICYHF